MFEEIFFPMGDGIIIPPVGGGECRIVCYCSCASESSLRDDSIGDDNADEVDDET